MKNFLKETMIAISKSGHTPYEIAYIGSLDGYSCTWEQFEELADVEYDPGFGTNRVPTDLVIVFNDGEHLCRGEYDGSEWWDHVCPLKIPQVRYEIKRVIHADGYDAYMGLKRLNIGD